MRKNSARRLFAVLVTAAVAAVTTVVLSPAPAHAVVNGNLLGKGTGSLYTENNIVNLGVVPGGSPGTFSVKVINTGSDLQQFKLTVLGSSPQITWTVLVGSTAVPTPYYTVPIDPGASVVLTVKVFVAGGAPQNQYVATVDLRNPETNGVLDSFYADANATYQSGNKRNDLFLKTGAQPFVGGSVDQYQTAPALKVGNTATYTLRLRNDGGTPANAIGLKRAFIGGSCEAPYTVTVKKGATNITAAVTSGTYTTGSLAPGAKLEFRVTIKLTSAPVCTSGYFYFESVGPDGSVVQAAHVVTAA